MFDLGYYIYSIILKNQISISQTVSKGMVSLFIAKNRHIFPFIGTFCMEANKEGPEIPQYHFCSINQKQRRNQMSFNYSEPTFDGIPEELDHLIALPLSEVPVSSSMAGGQRFKKEFEVLTPIQARRTLMKLIQKNKASSGRKNWKIDETNYLLFVVDRYCLSHGVDCQELQALDWHQISKLVPNRDSSACQFRYLSLCPSSITHAPWSSEERELLVRIIQNQNSTGITWKRISERLYEESREKVFRTGKQCREHYTCFLRPNLKKGAWTDEQDYNLMSLFLKLGKKWSKMTKFIDGRNQNSIKNRFFLIFESKSEMRYSNSDLIKIVRRRMDKISKKLAISHQERQIQEQNMNLTPTNSESSNFQIGRHNDDPSKTSNSTSHDQIFFNQCQEPHSQSVFKVEESSLFADEEFQRYIDL